jgi:hypothetical protein
MIAMRGNLLAAAALWISCFAHNGVCAFYLPGVNPQSFANGDV